MSEDMRGTEGDRRAAAQSAAGSGEVAVVGEAEPREILQMLSVRMEPQLIRQLRRVASEQGVRVSDLLRDAAEGIVARHDQATLILHVAPSPVRTPDIQPILTVSYFDGCEVHGSGVYSGVA